MAGKGLSFDIQELTSSVVDAVSSYSDEWAEAINITYDVRAKGKFYGDMKSLQHVLIIVVEHFLMNQPNLPVSLSCAIVQGPPNLATAMFCVSRGPESLKSSGFLENRLQLYEDSDLSVLKDRSLIIAKKIISFCGGDLLVRSSNSTPREVFIWAPLDVRQNGGQGGNKSFNGRKIHDA